MHFICSHGKGTAEQRARGMLWCWRVSLPRPQDKVTSLAPGTVPWACGFHGNIGDTRPKSVRARFARMSRTVMELADGSEAFLKRPPVAGGPGEGPGAAAVPEEPAQGAAGSLGPAQLSLRAQGCGCCCRRCCCSRGTAGAGWLQAKAAGDLCSSESKGTFGNKSTTKSAPNRCIQNEVFYISTNLFSGK